MVVEDLNNYTFNKKKVTIYLIYLKNLMTSITCVEFTADSSIDVLLANKPKSFHHTGTFKIGLSDYHKLVLTFLLKADFKKLPHKTI